MMKKPFFSRLTDVWERRRAAHLPLWIVFHLLILAGALIFARLEIKSDLNSILPATGRVESVSAAENKLNTELSRSFSILIGHKEFGAARRQALSLAAELTQLAGLVEVRAEIDPAVLSRLQEFLFLHRYKFLTPETRSLLESEKIKDLSERALILLASPLPLGNLDRLDLDPFLFVSEDLRYLLETSLPGRLNIGMRDNVFSADYDQKAWVLVTAKTGQSGLSFRTDENAIMSVHSLLKQVSSRNPDLEIVISGVPFHTFESVSSSQSEISILTTTSSVLVILLILFFFRSLKPLAATLAAIAVGVVTGLAAALLVFRELHLLTIVFGTSIIGISLDYAIHFYATEATLPADRPRPEVIRFILPGISLGLLTTLASYLGFLFTAFPLLQQMALFSMVGLISCFLTVTLIFPKFTSRRRKVSPFPAQAGRTLSKSFHFLQGLGTPLKIFLGILFLTLVAFGLPRLRLANDIRTIYRISPDLQKNEARAAAILNRGSSGTYLIVEGTDSEDVRQKEEILLADLEKLKTDGFLGPFLGSTLFVPSHQRQANDYRLSREHLRPEIENQLFKLGFGREEYLRWETDFQAQANRWIEPEDAAVLPINSFSGGLWLGESGNRWFSAVVIFEVMDRSKLKEAAAQNPSRHLVNKIEEVNATLQHLSTVALFILLAAYLVIFAGLIPRYGILQSAGTILIPLFASLITVSLLTLAGVPFNLFIVMGLILVPGMGTDYVIFFTEGKRHPGPTVLAIFISMLTTVSGFGLLAFTGLASGFGLTVGLGVFLCFFLTPLFTARVGKSRGLGSVIPPRGD